MRRIGRHEGRGRIDRRHAGDALFNDVFQRDGRQEKIDLPAEFVPEIMGEAPRAGAAIQASALLLFGSAAQQAK